MIFSYDPTLPLVPISAHPFPYRNSLLPLCRQALVPLYRIALFPLDHQSDLSPPVHQSPPLLMPHVHPSTLLKSHVHHSA